MNRSQKLLTVAALPLFFASVMLAPWANKGAEYKYQPMFFAPEYGYHLQWQNLIVEWLALGILYGWLFWLFGFFKQTELTLGRVIWTVVVVVVIVTIAGLCIIQFLP